MADSRAPRPKPYELNKSLSNSNSLRVSSTVANGSQIPDPPTPLHPPGNTGLPSASRSTSQLSSSSALSPSVPPRPTDLANASSPYSSPYRSGYGYGSSYGGYGSSYGTNSYGTNSIGTNSYGSGYGSYGSRYGSYSSPYSSYNSYGTSSYGSGYGSRYGYNSPYSSGYSSYGSGFGSSYNSPYSSYGRPYGTPNPSPYGPEQNPQGIFHNALQSGYNQIGKLGQMVESFSNFSRLLDANFDAVHGSFASVLRLMEVFGEFFFVVRSFTIVRLLFGSLGFVRPQGLVANGPRNDTVDVSDFLTNSNSGTRTNRTIPFLILLMTITVSAPMLLFKIWSMIKNRRNNANRLEGAWNEADEKNQIQPQQPIRGLGRALSDFRGETSRDLSFQKDETIHILDRPFAEWWVGETPDGRQGFFPANFVELIKEDQFDPARAAPPY